MSALATAVLAEATTVSTEASALSAEANARSAPASVVSTLPSVFAIAALAIRRILQRRVEILRTLLEHPRCVADIREHLGDSLAVLVVQQSDTFRRPY